VVRLFSPAKSSMLIWTGSFFCTMSLLTNALAPPGVSIVVAPRDLVFPEGRDPAVAVVGRGWWGEEEGGRGGRLTRCGQPVVTRGVAVEDERGEKGHEEVEYSARFKRTMIRKMVGPGRRTAAALAKETGVAQSTLSRWLRSAGSLGSMSEDNEQGTEQRRPQDWSAEEKLDVITEAEGLSEEELGAFLRRKGLHEVQLKQWRDLAREGALGALGSRKAEGLSKAEARRVRELERELRRKDKALAEAAALLVLQKKVQALWGDEDDDTDPKRGR
jgi:transposase